MVEYLAKSLKVAQLEIWLEKKKEKEKKKKTPEGLILGVFVVVVVVFVFVCLFVCLFVFSCIKITPKDIYQNNIKATLERVINLVN